MLHVGAHAFGRHAVDVDQLMVVAVDEIALHVEHIREAAGESGTEVHPGAPQHANDASGHVLAAVIARALDHRERAGVAHGETLAGGSRGVQFAAGRPVKTGVSHDHRVAGHEARGRMRLQHDPAAGHALADVIVRLPLEKQVQAARIPHAEALAGGALEMDDQGCRAHARIAPALRDLAGHARADGAMVVADRIGEFATGLGLDRAPHVLEHLLAEHALVEGCIAAVGAVLRLVRNQRRVREQGRQVELLLLGGFARQYLEELRAADELGDAAHADRGHDLAAFPRHEPEIIHHHLGQPDEILGPQDVVLGGDAGRAIVEVTDAQVLAAERDHRRRAEAEALGPDDGRLDHVEAGLQAAVGLQPHAMPKFVGTQCLVRFGEPELPRRAGVLDRGQGARPGAAVVARDRDQIGVGLGDAGRHGSDARLGHQLHRDQRLRVDLLQVEDQLREVLDGIDVMVRRRGDEADAGPREAQPRDHLVHLVAGKLPALAGLRPLRDLDLQHFGVDQVFRRDAESAGRHLLDLGILLGAVARRILAAFAGVGAGAQPVHGDGEGLVRLGRQGAQGHAGAVESLQNDALRLDLLHRNRRAARVQLEQVPDAGHRASVHERGVLAILPVVAARHRRLERRDHVRVVHVVLAAMHELEQPPLAHAFRRIPRAFRQVVGVRLEIRKIRALDAAVGTLEAERHDLRAQAHDLEQLGAAVAGDGRDAHLGHDFEQTLADAATIAPTQFLTRIVVGDGALAHQVEQRLIREIRIHRRRAVAQETGEVMRVARGARFDQDIALATQARLDQSMMHGARGEQRMDRHLALHEIAVRQEQHELPGAHRGLRLIADREYRAFQI